MRTIKIKTNRLRTNVKLKLYYQARTPASIKHWTVNISTITIDNESLSTNSKMNIISRALVVIAVKAL